MSMNSGLSLYFYRFLMQAYPAEFRARYGTSVDQAFRDMKRDAFERHGYLGLTLLWFHVIPDFLFSVAELVTKKAGDFLKWRFRLQWVIACSLGFGLARAIALATGIAFYRGLQAHGLPGLVLGTAIQMTVLMFSIGVTQAWVLAGRCFRKKEWVLYGIAGAVSAAVVLQPLVSALAPTQSQLVRLLQESFGYGFVRSVAVRLVTDAPVWLIFGALIGLLQSAAIRSDAVSRYQWMRACAAGYFLSALAGGFAIPYPYVSVWQLVLTMVLAGALMGLVTCGPLERVLFNLQADSQE